MQQNINSVATMVLISSRSKAI